MKVFMIVFGVLLILGGVSCLATPLLTLLETGYFLAMLLLIYGIISIVGGVTSKNYGVNFIYGILSAILGFVILFVPGLSGATSTMLMFIMAGWFVVKGITSIYGAVKAKETQEGSMWIWSIVAGVLAILMGIYSAIHPLVLAVAVGIMISMYFIISGVDMIATGMRYEEGA